MNMSGTQVGVLCTIFLGYTILVHSLNPVVFIPGDGGSQLDARINKTDVIHYICDKTSDWFNIWLNMELLVPLVIDCWVDNIKLVYNNQTRIKAPSGYSLEVCRNMDFAHNIMARPKEGLNRLIIHRTTTNPPGVEIRIPGFGTSQSVEWLDPSHASAGSYFKDISNTLVLAGYERNVSLRGAPFDFRKAPNENQEYFVRLKKLIEETYHQNNDSRVILIVHSMGGPMSLYFLNLQTQKWKDTYIDKLISLSGAWGGSTKAIKVYAVGDDLGSHLLSASVMKLEQITDPSLAWLMPSLHYWDPDETLVESPKINYTLRNIKDFFIDMEYPLGWEMYQDVLPHAQNFTAPGVEVHCLFGQGVDTVERLVYGPSKFWWWQSAPVLVSGDGDGTVNARSLQGCLKWPNQATQNGKQVYGVPLKNVDHMTILSHPAVLKYIKNIVTANDQIYEVINV